MWGRIKILYIVFVQMMQKNSALFVFLGVFSCMPLASYSQRGGEIGVQGGGSYYLGDLNLYKHFYSPHFNVGGFVKYHLNSRYVLRLGGVYTRLSANDADFNNDFQLLRDREFETSLVEVSAQFEIHFLPYLIGDVKRQSFTPYLQTGISAYIANSAQDVIGVAIPIGFGVKKNIKPQLVLGVEWTMRKTFSDYLDSVSGEDLSVYDPNYGMPMSEATRHKQTGFSYNKDWYSLASVTLSYTFKLGGLGCPAYYEYK